MKKQILFLIGLIAANALLAQVPQGISHQAVIRDANNELVASSQIGIQVSILQGSTEGVAVYVETHFPVSNASGLITYIIGEGDASEGQFAEIDWSAGPYFLKTEADPKGGTDYAITGVTQFLSVPYAFFAESFSGLQELMSRIEALEEALEDGEPEPGTLTDIDGNVYPTVIIGDQEWMAENLKVTRDASGNDITRYCFEDDLLNCELYGGLYTWYTVMNGEESSKDDLRFVQGICPDGWHVPSDAEWTQLVNYLRTEYGWPNDCFGVNSVGNKIKSCRQVNSPLGGDCDTDEHPRWDAHDIHFGTNDVGLSMLPGGSRCEAGECIEEDYGFWWSSTQQSDAEAWNRTIGNNLGCIFRGFNFNDNGFSVRCVRNTQ